MNEVNSISKKQMNFEQIRADFPILSRKINGRPLIYFDSGATAQKPQQVIDAVTNYYTNQNANIHRGIHTLSQEITIAFENARTVVQRHLNAAFSQEIIFTKGTTDSICLVASSFGKKFISSGDEIIVSEMEHHSNILPWQQLCEERNAVLKVIPINEAGELELKTFEALLTPKTKLIAITHVSNTLGTINPIKQLISLAHLKNIPVLVDGAQAVPHMSVDVQDLDADFYCFSGHKLFGPTGIGVLYGKEKWLNAMPPYQVGGGSITTVTFEKTQYAALPLKFEAGTPHIEGVIGLAAAIKYVNEIGLKNIATYEHELLGYAMSELMKLEGVKLIGTAKEKASVISFVIEGFHALDIGTILDQLGIAVRTGHHCTQPIMAHYGIAGTIRVSLAFYNSFHEIDELIKGLKQALKMLG